MLFDDGYMRLTLTHLKRLSFVHWLSGLDDDKPDNLRQAASATTLSGYTEWISASTPTATLGWDWQLKPYQGQHYCIRHYCIRVDRLRSNLMVIDAQQRDVGASQTIILLDMIIDTLGWQEITWQAIKDRYAATTCQS